jgi:glyoxylate reductase
MVKIFISMKLPSIARESLKEYFEVDENPSDAPLTHQELEQIVQKYDGILTTLADVINHEVLAKATRLKAISNYAIGLDNIALSKAKEMGIEVYNLPDIVTASTADLTFAIFLALIRKIPEARDYVRSGRWQHYDPSLFCGEELSNKTFGIVGFGRTGRAVAKRALGFGLKVLVHHRHPIAIEEQKQLQITQVPFDELLQQVNYLSLHVPLTEQTRFMIDQRAFQKMKKNPVLINVSRGAVVHPDALVDALVSGQIRGAALDVTFPEPISHHHPLCQMDHCLIVPHIGSATSECRIKMAKTAAQNLIAHFT